MSLHNTCKALVRRFCYGVHDIRFFFPFPGLFHLFLFFMRTCHCSLAISCRGPRSVGIQGSGSWTGWTDVSLSSISTFRYTCIVFPLNRWTSGISVGSRWGEDKVGEVCRKKAEKYFSVDGSGMFSAQRGTLLRKGVLEVRIILGAVVCVCSSPSWLDSKRPRWG